jgi:hypothetical protein
LLHTITDRMVIVFGLDDSNRDIGLVVEQIIDLFGFAAPDILALQSLSLW